jgi:peptide chain release factor 2
MGEEAADTLKEIEDRLDQWETERLLCGFYDENDAVLTVLAGAGGTESQAWASSLLEMYCSWAAAMGYQVSKTECSLGSMPGLVKSATLLIEGRYAYGYLKQERGNHRIQRISPFGNGKRHTSFAGIEVIPLIKGVEFELNLNEVEITTCRSGGKGGQNVNKLETAVRAVHLPSGIQVRCEEQRTQHQNKERALEILRAKLAALEQQRQDLHLQEIRGEQFGTGFGSRIRTYSFDPYKLIKDDRTGVETRNVDAFMAGDREEIGAFIRASLLEGTSMQ